MSLAGRDPWAKEEELWPIRPPCRTDGTVHNRVAKFLPPAHMLAAAFVILAPPASYTACQHTRLSRIAALCLLPAFSATTRRKKSWSIGVGEVSHAQLLMHAHTDTVLLDHKSLNGSGFDGHS